jgi:beta-lactamase class A
MTRNEAVREGCLKVMQGTRRAAAGALCAVLLAAGCRASADRPGVPARPVPAAISAAAQPSPVPPIAVPSTVTPMLSTAAPTPPPPPSAAAVATRRIAALAAGLAPGAISVAVLNARTGARYSWRGTSGMWTGSVYKLFVLEALLLQRQGSSGWFSASDYSDITAMIEQSDNAAGYRMYLAAGGSAGLVTAARKLGLRHTSIGLADPALTTMSASDGVRLLHDLVAPGPLDTHSRAFVLGMMRNVQADQRWGVGVLADRHTTFANKNGWMDVDDDNDPAEDDGDRWLVDSLGVVRVHGQPLLVAVFTRHNPDFESGVRLVEKLARLIGPAVT